MNLFVHRGYRNSIVPIMVKTGCLIMGSKCLASSLDGKFCVENPTQHSRNFLIKHMFDFACKVQVVEVQSIGICEGMPVPQSNFFSTGEGAKNPRRLMNE